MNLSVKLTFYLLLQLNKGRQGEVSVNTKLKKKECPGQHTRQFSGAFLSSTTRPECLKIISTQKSLLQRKHPTLVLSSLGV